MKKIPSIPIEEQVVSLEVAKRLAKKLKEAGIEFESVNNYYRALTYSWHHKKRTENTHDWRLNIREECFPGADGVRWEKVPAPTLTEMLGMLPDKITETGKYDEDFILTLQKRRIFYARSDGSLDDGVIINNNINSATAAALLMIWLIDNGHVKGDK